jgi:hypothetical protein
VDLWLIAQTLLRYDHSTGVAVLACLHRDDPWVPPQARPTHISGERIWHACFSSPSHSCRIRPSSADAGSSSGSWETSSPRKARASTAWSTCCSRRRQAYTCASRISAWAKRASMRATMRRCSARGAMATGTLLRFLPEMPCCPAEDLTISSMVFRAVLVVRFNSRYCGSTNSSNTLARISLSG